MADKVLPTRTITEPIPDNIIAETEIEYRLTRRVDADGTVHRRVEIQYKHPLEAKTYIKVWENDAIPTGAGSVGLMGRNAVIAALNTAKIEWGF